MDEDLPPHVQWLLDRRGPALSERLAREGARLPPGSALRVLMDADPSAGKVATQWLCDSYLAGGFLWEDAAAGAGSKAAETLRLFAEHRAHLPVAERNLSAHAGLASIYKAVKPLLAGRGEAREEPSGKALRREERERALAESVVVYRSGDLVVAVPLTEDASRWWGRGTRWCTAADKDCYFHEYSRSGPLVVMVMPGREPGEPVRKWQLHVGEYGAHLMDEDDAPVPPELIDANWDRVGEILEWATRMEGNALRFIPESRQDPGLCMDAVSKDGMALRHVPLRHATPELRMEAVRQKGLALMFVRLAFRTPEICMEAVRQNGLVLFFVPEEIRTHRMCVEAMLNDPEAMPHVPLALMGGVASELRSKEINNGPMRKNSRPPVFPAWNTSVLDDLSERLRARPGNSAPPGP